MGNQERLYPTRQALESHAASQPLARNGGEIRYDDYGVGDAVPNGRDRVQVFSALVYGRPEGRERADYESFLSFVRRQNPGIMPLKVRVVGVTITGTESQGSQSFAGAVVEEAPR